MKRLIIAVLVVLAAGCEERRQDAEFKIEKTVAETRQREVVAELRGLAARQGFVSLEDSFKKDGREVWQLDMKSSECLLMTSDNLTAPNIVSVYFYSCRQSDWRRLRDMVLPIVGG